MRISDWSSDVCSSDLVLLHQLRVVLDGLGHRAEDDALLGQLLAERGADRDRVEHRVHGHAGELGAFMQRNTELVVGVEQLLRHFVERLVLRALGRGVIADRSEEHTSELQSLMRNSYAVFCLKKKKE